MVNNRNIKLTVEEKIIITLFISISFIYLGLTIFFRTHFYNTRINGLNMFGKSIEDAKVIISNDLDNYCLKINEENHKSKYIIGKDIKLKYDLGEQIENLKKEEDTFWCIAKLLKNKEAKTDNRVIIDEELLKESINNMMDLRKNNILENENPKIEYKNNEYVIIDEKYGNIIDKQVLEKKLKKCIENAEDEINIEDLDCYEKPEYTSKSKKVIEAKDMINKYASTKVTYCFGENKEILDKNTIHDWLNVNEDYEIQINEESVRQYINKLADKYNTVERNRRFITSFGRNIEISGGDYGYIIDEEFETALLIDAIKLGKNIVKEPEYSRSALSYDKDNIGNTYVEINLSKQHLWFYKSGKLITEGDIVSGNVNNDWTTPAGVYSLVYKQKDTVLRGDGYASPVSFWMPFNGGIGIHDASWRYTFGGNIYINNGSHGCINAPYYLANEIFNNIESGTPVVCYYE
ncbi:MAG: peptidoglycan-binding protein [Clostridium butyricum]|nr:peptidoglycan-binding protein [Clostridium butyricum]